MKGQTFICAEKERSVLPTTEKKWEKEKKISGEEGVKSLAAANAGSLSIALLSGIWAVSSQKQQGHRVSILEAFLKQWSTLLSEHSCTSLIKIHMYCL